MLTRALSLAVLVLLASSASAAPVVAVLYFDNNTGDQAFDVLRKGLADMLVTDVSTLGVTVVERARLQALLDEHALQATSFIDNQTAIGTGHGLGATHVLTGSFVGVMPELRIDARVVDVATGAVVAVIKVAGPSNDVFALEQQLVAKLAEALTLKFAAAPLPTTKVKDLPTLLDYAKALDLTDHGEVEPAKNALDALVKKAPAFGLARVRREELVARLAQSIDRRAQAQSDAEAAIERIAKPTLERDLDPKAGRAEVTRMLGLRVLHGRIVLRRLARELSTREGLGTYRRESKDAFIDATGIWLTNQLTIIGFLDFALQSFPDIDRVRFDGELERYIDTADLGVVDLDPIHLRLELAALGLLGEHNVEPKLRFAPPPALPSIPFNKFVLEALQEAVVRADALAAGGAQPGLAYQARELWGEYLLLVGDVEGAVAKWQEALDKYPSAPYFEGLERRIKKALGLESDHRTRALADWRRGLVTCNERDLRGALDTRLDVAFRLAGVDGFQAVVREVEVGCRGQDSLKRLWDYLYEKAALGYGKHGYCGDFERLMRASMDHGGSQSEVDAYRKNYTSCGTR